MNYQEREDAKKIAWAVLIRPDVSPREKAFHALKLIEAHYWRAREAVEGMPAPMRRKVHGRRYSRFYELDIDVYTRHWLWANGEKCLPASVLEVLKDDWFYEPEQHKMLGKGCSTYGERVGKVMRIKP